MAFRNPSLYWPQSSTCSIIKSAGYTWSTQLGTSPILYSLESPVIGSKMITDAISLFNPIAVYLIVGIIQYGLPSLSISKFLAPNILVGYLNLKCLFKSFEKIADGTYFIPLSNFTKLASPVTEFTVM